MSDTLSPEDIAVFEARAAQIPGAKADQARDIEAQAVSQEAAEQSVTRGFGLTSLAERLKEPKPTRWLIHGHAVQKTLTVIFGEPNSGKSFISLDRALCIAAGIPWQGHKTKQGPVIIICGEGNEEYDKRVKAWCEQHSINHSTLPVNISDQPAQFLDKDSADDVIAAVAKFAKENGSPILVLVDTLNSNFGPGDENTTTDMSEFIGAMTTLRNTFECAVDVVHHTGHGDKDRPRGAAALMGAADFLFLIKGTVGTRTMKCTKCKDHARPADMEFNLEQVAIEWIEPETGEPMTSCVPQRVAGTPGRVKKLTGAQAAVLKALIVSCGNNGTGHSHLEDWRVEAYRTAGLTTKSDTVDAKKHAFKRATEELIASGDVELTDLRDHFRPTIQAGTCGTAGQDRDMSLSCPGQIAGQTGTHSYKECPVSRPSLLGAEVRA